LSLRYRLRLSIWSSLVVLAVVLVKVEEAVPVVI
jgi:hypothetical protein